MERRNATASVIAAMPFMVYGAVKGAGTSRSDSIPAMLSDGEFVLNAQAVSRIGLPTLHMLNAGAAPAFADGGIVGVKSEGFPTEGTGVG